MHGSGTHRIVLTPDGKPMSDSRLCTCAVHCTNRCEPCHCPEVTPWCVCWCHEAEYATMDHASVSDYTKGA